MGVSAATYDALGDVEFVAHWRRGGVDSDDFGHVSPKKKSYKKIHSASLVPSNQELAFSGALPCFWDRREGASAFLFIYIYVCIYVHIEGRGRNQPP